MSRVVRSLVVILAFAVVLVTIVRAAGDPAISKAAKAGDLATVKKLIASRTDVNVASGDGSTPILWAVHNFDFEMVEGAHRGRSQSRCREQLRRYTFTGCEPNRRPDHDRTSSKSGRRPKANSYGRRDAADGGRALRQPSRGAPVA